MRAYWIVGLSALALTACGKKDEAAAPTGDAAQASATAPAAPAGPAAPPKRKAGLWSQTVSTAGMTQGSKICLDEAMEAKLTAWGQQTGDDMCARNVITPTPGGWKFESECSMGQGGKTVTTGTATGDFNSKYVIKATTVTTGAAMPQANGTHQMEMTAAWEGPCPAGMKPGDMQLSNGMTINMGDMTRGK